MKKSPKDILLDGKVVSIREDIIGGSLRITLVIENEATGKRQSILFINSAQQGDISFLISDLKQGKNVRIEGKVDLAVLVDGQLKYAIKLSQGGF